MSDDTKFLEALSTVVLGYIGWNILRELPFNYITQTEQPICQIMNGSFCSRLSYAVAAFIVYMIAASLSGQNALTAKNPVATGIQGAGIGAALAISATVLNILFGFIRIKGIDTSKITQLPPIVAGMALTGFTEEIMFRALPIDLLGPYIGYDLMIWLAALFFGYLHARYSLQYGVAAFLSGLLLGYGFLKYNIYWSIGLHSAFNAIETGFYTMADVSVKNEFMAGERKTPDDDGNTSSFLTVIFLGLQYINWI
jgi:membrane protease YdiL (CAAX protease family)